MEHLEQAVEALDIKLSVNDIKRLEELCQVYYPLQLWEIQLVLGLTFVTGYLSMEFLLRLSKKVNFALFCLLFGLIALVLNLSFKTEYFICKIGRKTDPV